MSDREHGIEIVREHLCSIVPYLQCTCRQMLLALVLCWSGEWEGALERREGDWEGALERREGGRLGGRLKGRLGGSIRVEGGRLGGSIRVEGGRLGGEH